MKEKTNLENINGGAGGASKYYCVEGYSETKKGNVKMYVSTYEDAWERNVLRKSRADSRKERTYERKIEFRGNELRKWRIWV